jgi:hypothetical protein
LWALVVPSGGEGTVKKKHGLCVVDSVSRLWLHCLWPRLKPLPSMSARPSRRRGRLTEQQEAAAKQLREIREAGGKRTDCDEVSTFTGAWTSFASLLRARVQAEEEVGVYEEVDEREFEARSAGDRQSAQDFIEDDGTACLSRFDRAWPVLLSALTVAGAGYRRNWLPRRRRRRRRFLGRRDGQQKWCAAKQLGCAPLALTRFFTHASARCTRSFEKAAPGRWNGPAIDELGHVHAQGSERQSVQLAGFIVAHRL